MCTPENLRENCSCPHLILSRARSLGKAAVVLAVGGCLVWLLMAGYGWVLALVAWLAVMGAVALLRGRWLVHRYIPPSPQPERAPEPPRRAAWTDRDRLPPRDAAASR